MRARSLDGGVLERQVLVCRHVTDLHYVNPAPQSWENVEISEASVERVASGVRVRLEIWLPEVELTITAGEVLLDGRRILAE